MKSTLCRLVIAVAKYVSESLTARQITNGFLPRLLILEGRGRGVGRDNTERLIRPS